MDLDSLFKRAFDGFGDASEAAEFPGVPGSTEASGNGYHIDKTCISRCSRNSRSEKEVLVPDHNFELKSGANFSFDDRAHEAPFKTPGNPGNPGKEGKVPAETTTYIFPEEDNVPGNAGKNARSASALFSTATETSFSPADPLPISPADVRAGVARELRALGDLGRTGPDALRDAIEIVAAKIRNSAALVESQSMDGRCHVCREPLDGTRPEVAVMQGKPGSPLHIHSVCHADHKARRTALVDRIMAAAGYGPAHMDGEAA